MASINVFLNLFIILIALSSSSVNAQGLKVGFYQKTCPQAEAIILKEMRRVISLAPTLGAPLLRLHFHDCFIRGCDASILLNSKNGTAEKDGIPNLSLRGYGVIDGIKTKLEKACPGVVSCADIIALVARDAVFLINGPFWPVLTGRRDGMVSNAIETIFGLPSPFANITQSKANFASKGLSAKDLVVLSGAHTIGTSHCPSFSLRLYNFTGKGDADPSLDRQYAARLRSKCKPNDITTLVEMDPGSFKTFDTSYYKLVAKRRGLFVSDEALLHDPETKAYVLRQAAGTSPEFFKDFGESMVKMGNIGVLTGKQGEIRKQCGFVN
ncbi:peroxidase 27-like [Dioscorea cayenensis subsp. rotundata]|uniref:Peroxidase n=1 Tax=Dioscorea cayennensis subsp. rotundata TaxID=55577 RepID=A0AB40AIM5_DIOCR|nr:peroxidase 27-like [Dioscorea cayenensis subsp. rotundata]